MAQNKDVPSTKLIFEELRDEMRRLHEERLAQMSESYERILQAFLTIAIPNEIRMTQTENDCRRSGKRLAAAEGRLSEVDRRVPTGR